MIDFFATDEKTNHSWNHHWRRGFETVIMSHDSPLRMKIE